MAYQTRGRDPLFDSDVQAAIEKRGKELLGLLLIVLGCAAAAMVVSYNPEDPSFLSATDAPVQNWMGRTGATIAAPLFMIAGWGSWVIAIVLFAWGIRFTLHIGEERAVGRLIFAPIAVALCSVYAATLYPGAVWEAIHHFGLGGVFGDMIMGMILTALPLGSAVGIKLASLVLALVMLALGAFVLGFTRVELRRISRFLLIGVIMAYARLMQVMGRGASGTVHMAQTMQARAAERRLIRTREAQEASDFAASHDTTGAPMNQQVAPRAQSGRSPLVARRNDRPAAVPSAPVEPSVSAQWAQDADWQDAPDLPQQAPWPQSETAYDDHAWAEDDTPPEPSQGPIAKITTGLLGRVPGLGRKSAGMPEPELVEQYPAAAYAAHDLAPGDDRIRARIADVIKSRVRPVPPMAQVQHAPLTRGRGRGPDPLVFNPAARPATLKAEPPLTAAHKPAVAAMAEMAASALPVAAAGAASVSTTHASGYIAGADFAALPDDDAINIFDDAYDPVYDVSDHTAFDGDEGAADMAEAAFEYRADPRPAPAPMHIPVASPRAVVQHPPRKPVQPSARAKAEAQPSLKFDAADAVYELPPLALLSNPALIQRHHLSDEALEQNARMLESVLDDYGVKGEIVSVRPGPVVTMYELEPAPGLKASRVIGLADDIARSMSALSARVSTVPGRTVIGIELPNENREKVVLREILSARDYGDNNMKLSLALGKDIGGDPIVANLAKMPHLLIAGTTGSGKSVAINTMILSLLYRLTPEECRMIMIDPKMLELSVYDGIPHLLSPVVTDPKKAVVALKWVVGEMEERYRKMSKMGVRNIDGYNSRVADALAKGEMFSRTVQTGFDDDTGEPVFETEELMPEKMPYIVVIVDEMADLMMVAGKEIEACIQRLAQMARASGIHLIMATQRPSVDVITGTIKANFPTRISFQVTSKIDSRTILGEMGAEQLLGMGDMLYMAGGAKITRCHGPFVSDEEVEEIVNHLKAYGPPEYMNSVLDGPDEDREADIDAVLGLASGGNTDMEDALYDTAVAIVVKDRKCSTSYIQRKLAIGYNKAARLVEQMEDQGVVSAANHVGKREVLVPEH